MSILLLPPFAVGDQVTITVNTDGFVPRIIMVANSTGTRFQSLGTTAGHTMNFTVTIADYYFFHITSVVAGASGNVTSVSITGPSAFVDRTDPDAAAALKAMPIGMAVPAELRRPPWL